MDKSLSEFEPPCYQVQVVEIADTGKIVDLVEVLISIFGYIYCTAFHPYFQPARKPHYDRQDKSMDSP